ncbi:MAG: 16S rRNA (guanine(966)-N(2))-methyltransferase RsmD [Deltaproteobacteria bacterium]|nr:16S rRNA (guanine(966)-N(2))-methyltransferase RsmD [Deltaproteobacteria bacterium]
MRIIAGIARGRKLISPGAKGGKNEIRPTSDRAREALFNILGSDVCGARVLDLFAGTGALGLEALSRGADSAVFIDKSQTAIGMINKNIQRTGFSDKVTILKRDLSKKNFLDSKYIPGKGFSLVFMDPPYRTDLAIELLSLLGRGSYVARQGVVVAESSVNVQLPEKTGLLKCYDKRQYGETAFWLYLLQNRDKI